MKKLMTIVITILFSLTVFAQTESATIEKANELIANKKYSSVFFIQTRFFYYKKLT